MPLFDNAAEKQRKENLKINEDKRLRFAEELNRMGFKPEKMLFCSSEVGNFVALAHWNGKIAVIAAPTFGQEGEYVLELHDKVEYEKEEVYQKGTGLNGALGFGTKGAKGFNVHIAMQNGSTVVLQLVAGRTSWLVAPLKKNPLLATKRRRGNANVVWDLAPLDMTNLDKAEALLFGEYLA